VRSLHLAFFALWVFLSGSARAAPSVVPGYSIQLPRDGGSHPTFGTEWWYVTGWLKDEAGRQRGFQITFFRSRNASADGNPSAFAPKQILFAHAAISDPQEKQLLRGERVARAGFNLAEANESKTDVFIDDWSLAESNGGYTAKLVARDFGISLDLRSTQSPLLQGNDGYSRKGPTPASASYYYSVPHLAVRGTIAIRKNKYEVTGEAWLDHEWSDSYMDPQSVGWDWIGINLANGDALMAFRMRDSASKQVWAGATLRSGQTVSTFEPHEIQWNVTDRWRSPRTRVEFPIGGEVIVGSRKIRLKPLMADQENDARGSVGILYWEGAVDALDETGKKIGQGYLEMTGYGEAARF
jgi:predicted secreted hydrolase